MVLQNEASPLGRVFAGKNGEGALSTRVGSQSTLFIALSGVAAGSLITACGVGKLLIYKGHPDAPQVAAVHNLDRMVAYGLLVVGAAIALLSLKNTLGYLQRLEKTAEDCIRYGRHIVGLTFAMLVVGMCNAVVACTLAIGGDLTFSATAILEASDPKHAKEAELRSLGAETAEKNLERVVKLGELELGVAARKAISVCAAFPGADCETAREAERNIGDELARKRMDLAEAHDAFWRGKHECELTRGRSRRALFFLLTMSTMTAVLGASFYVVNCVRQKRPRLVKDTDEAKAEVGEAPIVAPQASETSVSAGEARVSPAPSSAASKDPSAGRRECFDVHEFWSGAFFRFGEAVLFTFAFFWLIWTSEENERVIWLPVLALFVGMFVKTGEVVVFSLGKRILLAVDALLPGGTSTPSRPKPGAPPPPSNVARAA